MGVLNAMWSLISGRAAQRDAEQQLVSRALAMQRAETIANVRSIEEEAHKLEGADTVMLRYLQGTMQAASRARRKQ